MNITTPVAILLAGVLIALILLINGTKGLGQSAYLLDSKDHLVIKINRTTGYACVVSYLHPDIQDLHKTYKVCGVAP